MTNKILIGVTILICALTIWAYGFYGQDDKEFINCIATNCSPAIKQLGGVTALLVAS